MIIILAGNMVSQQVPQDLMSVINAISTPVQNTGANGTYTGYSSNSPLVEIMDSGIELMRRTPMPQLLEGLALMVQQNPTQFQTTVTDLVVGINLAKQSGFSSAGSGQMLKPAPPPPLAGGGPEREQHLRDPRAPRELQHGPGTAPEPARRLRPDDAIQQLRHEDAHGPRPAVGHVPQLLDIMQRSNQCSPIISATWPTSTLT